MSVSKLFNFSNLLAESSMRLVKPVRESHCLSDAVEIVKEFDNSIQENTRTLYDALLEAESKKDENHCFGKYYAQYKDDINKLESQMKELASRFYINLETLVDANVSVLDKQCCCSTGQTFRGAQFTNLLSDDIPNINPYKAFKKEWNFLGRLFQDLDPSTSDEEKAKIIATVYNSLCKEINDGWLDKCIEKIADTDKCSKDTFAKVMYDKFVCNGDVEINLDTPNVEQSKLSLRNYTNYSECIRKSVDEFCTNINKISSELGSMLFRNMDKKFEVNTDEEGIANATYRLNDYAMNQIDMFLHTKVSQIRELTNLYIIALSIKMDCIYKYIKQCVTIIEAACGASPINPSESEEEPTPELPTGKSSTEFDDAEGIDEPSDDDELLDGEEPTPDIENPDDDPEGIEPNAPVSGGEEGDEAIDASEPEEPNPEGENPTEESYISKFDEEMYLSEANIALLHRYGSYEDLHREYIKEDGEPVPAAVEDSDKSVEGPASSAEPVMSPEEAAGQRGKSLLQKVKDLVNSAKDSKNGTFATQIKFISENKDVILKAPIPTNWTIQNYDLSSFGSINITPLNFKEKELYKNKNEFLKSKYGKFGKLSENGEGNVIDFFLNKVYSDKEVKYDDKIRTMGFNYVVKEYDALYTHGMKLGEELSKIYNKEYDIMMKAKGASDNKGKVTKESTMAEYFTEDFTGVDEAGTAEPDWKERWNIVQSWFDINYTVLVAYFNITSRNFKKQYAFLKKLESIKK